MLYLGRECTRTFLLLARTSGRFLLCPSLLMGSLTTFRAFSVFSFLETRSTDYIAHTYTTGEGKLNQTLEISTSSRPNVLQYRRISLPMRPKETSSPLSHTSEAFPDQPTQPMTLPAASPTVLPRVHGHADQRTTLQDILAQRRAAVSFDTPSRLPQGGRTSLRPAALRTTNAALSPHARTAVRPYQRSQPTVAKNASALLWYSLTAGGIVTLYTIVPFTTTLVPFLSLDWARLLVALGLLGLGEWAICRILLKTTKTVRYS